MKMPPDDKPLEPRISMIDALHLLTGIVETALPERLLRRERPPRESAEGRRLAAEEAAEWDRWTKAPGEEVFGAAADGPQLTRAEEEVFGPVWRLEERERASEAAEQKLIRACQWGEVHAISRTGRIVPPSFWGEIGETVTLLPTHSRMICGRHDLRVSFRLREIQALAEPDNEEPPRRKPGRPDRYDWPAFNRRLDKWAESVDGLPDNLVEEMRAWCAENWPKVPCDDTIRKRIRDRREGRTG